MGGQPKQQTTSQTITETTTEQKDLRTVGTDSAIVFGSGAIAEGAEVTIENLPPGLQAFGLGLLDLVEEVGQKAFEASSTTIVAQKEASNTLVRLVFIGIAGITLVSIFRGGKNAK